MYVFGIDLPLTEIQFVLTILLLAAIVFIFLQMRHLTKHVSVLEDTTLQIKRFEEQELEQVRRFETDMKALEADEAELFVTRIVPTVSKLENYVAAELLQSKEPDVIKGNLIKRGVNSELATRVVNNMTYYMDFFQKLPDKNVSAQLKTVEQMKVTQPAAK